MDVHLLRFILLGRKRIHLLFSNQTPSSALKTEKNQPNFKMHPKDVQLCDQQMASMKRYFSDPSSCSCLSGRFLSSLLAVTLLSPINNM